MAVKEKVDYGTYMASREWRTKRKEVIKQAGGICERCQSARIRDVHHLTYETLGHEDPTDLLGLCRPCHEYISAERDDDPAQEVIWRLIKEHGLTPDFGDISGDLLWFEVVEYNGHDLCVTLSSGNWKEGNLWGTHKLAIIDFGYGVFGLCFWL